MPSALGASADSQKCNGFTRELEIGMRQGCFMTSTSLPLGNGFDDPTSAPNALRESKKTACIANNLKILNVTTRVMIGALKRLRLTEKRPATIFAIYYIVNSAALHANTPKHTYKLAPNLAPQAFTAAIAYCINSPLIKPQEKQTSSLMHQNIAKVQVHFQRPRLETLSRPLPSKYNTHASLNSTVSTYSDSKRHT